MSYVDGFLVPVPKGKIADYKKLAAGTPKEREDTRAMCEDSVKKFPHAICR